MKFAIIGGAILLVLIVIGVIAGGGEKTPKVSPVEPTVTLKQAESSIVSSGDGLAYSNSEAGQALAAEFSAQFKKAALDGTDTIKERHDFITHCQLNDDSVLFLVHVPKLRKFDKESKERFCEIGWVIAQNVLTENFLTKNNIKLDTKLAVGVKGLALYQNIYFGKFNPENLSDELTGVTLKSKDSSLLEEFFKTPPTK
ncbi:hypothetical protein N9891_01060, partial [bacterium]|nr:hypothetical protein [bacterium]